MTACRRQTSLTVSSGGSESFGTPHLQRARLEQRLDRLLVVARRLVDLGKQLLDLVVLRSNDAAAAVGGAPRGMRRAAPCVKRSAFAEQSWRDPVWSSGRRALACMRASAPACVCVFVCVRVCVCVTVCVCARVGFVDSIGGEVPRSSSESRRFGAAP